MVADHQGGEHQGGVSSYAPAVTASGQKRRTNGVCGESAEHQTPDKLVRHPTARPYPVSCDPEVDLELPKGLIANGLGSDGVAS
jgi:hypothetical protein